MNKYLLHEFMERLVNCWRIKEWNQRMKKLSSNAKCAFNLTELIYEPIHPKGKWTRNKKKKVPTKSNGPIHAVVTEQNWAIRNSKGRQSILNE